MASYGNDLQSYRRFLDNFCQQLRTKGKRTSTTTATAAVVDGGRAGDQEDKVPLFYDYIVQCEVEGECLEWIRQYLDHYDCPSSLTACIARCTCDEVLKKDLSHFYVIPTENNKPQEIDAHELLKEVIAQLHEVCLRLQGSLPKFKVPDRSYRVSASAIRNCRRKMEDRHIILPDINNLFALKGYPSQSYCAVYDGHSGVEAAVYTMTHLHCNMVRSPYFASDVPRALKYSYKLTDKHFLEKSERERLRSGTTGITALIRGSTVYISWLGDSQAVLVCNGQAKDLTTPHTPDRQDEKERIEDLGGIVIEVSGISRVNGNISVSRAIGDASQKPCISSDADVITYELDGSEDYLVLACDGAWDCLEKDDLPYIIYNHVHKNNGQFSTVAESLIKYSRDNGSKDNISVIVVFFREELSDPHSALQDAVRENGENQKHDENPNQSSDRSNRNANSDASSSYPSSRQHRDTGDSNGSSKPEQESNYCGNERLICCMQSSEPAASNNGNQTAEMVTVEETAFPRTPKSNSLLEPFKQSGCSRLCDGRAVLQKETSSDLCTGVCSHSGPSEKCSMCSGNRVVIWKPDSQHGSTSLKQHPQLSLHYPAFVKNSVNALLLKAFLARASSLWQTSSAAGSECHLCSVDMLNTNRVNTVPAQQGCVPSCLSVLPTMPTSSPVWCLKDHPQLAATVASAHRPRLCSRHQRLQSACLSFNDAERWSPLCPACPPSQLQNAVCRYYQVLHSSYPSSSSYAQPHSGLSIGALPLSATTSSSPLVVS